jgi:hypothetical protein
MPSSRTTCAHTLRAMRRPEGLLLAVVLAGCGATAEPAPTPAPRPARTFLVARDYARPGHHFRYLTAGLLRASRLYSRPGGRVVGRLRTRTEFGSETILGVLRRRGGWLEVSVAQLPNGHHAWVRAANTVVAGTDYEIRVDRSAHTAALRRGSHVVVRFPVAVGRPGNATPLGRYAVTDKLRPVDSTSPYGCCALALTGHQTRLEPGWPGGDRLAIHGTPDPSSIGQAVSLGCMRAPAAALHVLMRRVPLGTPVVVRA